MREPAIQTRPLNIRPGPTNLKFKCKALDHNQKEADVYSFYTCPITKVSQPRSLCRRLLLTIRFLLGCLLLRLLQLLLQALQHPKKDGLHDHPCIVIQLLHLQGQDGVCMDGDGARWRPASQAHPPPAPLPHPACPPPHACHPSF
ncbi:hypothetical protein VPH35_038075 [Triticum aestivum]